jgi:hypothetical protein
MCSRKLECKADVVTIGVLKLGHRDDFRGRDGWDRFAKHAGKA